jgi:hypothetical protein
MTPTTRSTEAEIVWPTEPGWYDLINRDGVPCPFLLNEQGRWWCIVDDPSWRPDTLFLMEHGFRLVSPGASPRDRPHP